MTKKEILDELAKAKMAHVQWLQRAKYLVKGIGSLDKGDIPVDPTSCPFGKWLYEKAHILQGLPNNLGDEVKEIEKLHQQLHDEYLKIYSIYFERKKGLLSKLFGKEKKVSAAEQEIAEEYFEKLEKISHELEDKLDKLERRILAMPEEEIEKLLK